MKLRIALVALLVSASPSYPQDDEWVSPRSGPGYEITEPTWQQHVAAGGDFAEALDKIERRGSRRSEGQVYLALAHEVANRLGHHDLVFQLIDRARETGAPSAEIQMLEEKAYSAKLHALQSLGAAPLREPPNTVNAVAKENALLTIFLPCNTSQKTPELRAQLERGEAYLLTSPYSHPPTATVEDAVVIDSGLMVLDRNYLRKARESSEKMRDQEARGEKVGFTTEQQEAWLRTALKVSSDPCAWVRLDNLKALFLRSTESTIITTKGKSAGRSNFRPFLISKWEFGDFPELDRVPFLSGKDHLALLTDFANRYPQSLPELETAFDHSFFLAVRDRDSLEAYLEYRSAFPGGVHALEADSVVAQKRFEALLHAPSEGALVGFLKRYPDFPQRDRVEEELSLLAVEATDDIEELALRFASVASDRVRERARKRIEDLEYLAASRSDSVDALTAFLDKYPTSEFRSEAERSIRDIRDGARFSSVRQANSRRAYEDFLDKYPATRFKAEAEAMLAFFDLKSSKTLGDLERFFRIQKRVRLREVTAAEHEAALEILRRKIADRVEPLSEALLLLHSEDPDPLYPVAAYGAARSDEEEFRALQAMSPEQLLAVFPVGLTSSTFEANESWEVHWFLASDKDFVRPELSGWIRSKARYGQYRVTVELSLEVSYTKSYVGIVWFNPDYKNDTTYWEETFRASSIATLSPERSGEEKTNIEFDFPQILLRRSPGFEFAVGWETIGRPSEEFKPRIVDVQLR